MTRTFLRWRRRPWLRATKARKGWWLCGDEGEEDKECELFLCGLREEESVDARREWRANGLLRTPASHLNPTKHRGEEIRCTRNPTNPVYYGR